MFLSSLSFSRMMHSETGAKLLSIVWGLGLAVLLFYQVCDGPECIVLKAPQNTIEDHVYKYDQRCYRFDSYKTKCGSCPVKSRPQPKDKGGKCKEKFVTF